MSSVVLSGQTALNVYKALRQQWDTIKPVKFTKKVRVPTAEEINLLKTLDDIDFSALEVLLSEKNQHRPTCDATQKFYTQSQSGIAVSINTNNPFFLPGNFLVVSPAFLIAQLSSKLPLVNTFLTALWLGGSYTISTTTGELLADRDPLLTYKQLAFMEQKLAPNRWSGFSNFKKVVKHFAPNSASPMESELYTKLSLPQTLGGFNIEGISMNTTIKLSAEACKIAGQASARVDFLHQQSKVVIEYDSTQHHANDLQSQRDKRRRDALQRDGYKCFSIVTKQINDREIFNECARPIVAAIKGRCRVRTKNFDFHQQQLFRQLKFAREGFLAVKLLRSRLLV